MEREIKNAGTLGPTVGERSWETWAQCTNSSWIEARRYEGVRH